MNYLEKLHLVNQALVRPLVGFCILFLFLLVPQFISQTNTLETAKQPTEQKRSVIVEKTNGDRLTGTFIGADENAVRVSISNTELTISLSDILLIRIVQSDNSIVPVENQVELPVKVESPIVKGRAIFIPQPEYPKEARSIKASGPVEVEIKVDERGLVVSSRAIDGNPVFYAAAEKAAMQSRFEPSFQNGKPVSVSGKIKFAFYYKR